MRSIKRRSEKKQKLHLPESNIAGSVNNGPGHDWENEDVVKSVHGQMR